MQTQVSLLPNLEPMLGFAFALNLAYIGLARFRYRSEIRNFVLTEMGDLKTAPEHITSTDWYKAVARLSSLEDFDRRWTQKSDKNAQLTGLWSTIYTHWFECHQDYFMVVTGTVLTCILLAGGVAHTVGMFGYTHFLFSKDSIHFSFWLTVYLSCLPVVSVIAGKYTVSRAKLFASGHIKDLKKQLQAGAQTASIPDPK